MGSVPILPDGDPSPDKDQGSYPKSDGYTDTHDGHSYHDRFYGCASGDRYRYARLTHGDNRTNRYYHSTDRYDGTN